MDTVSGIVADLQGNITHYGKGAEKIFGWTPKEVVGKPVSMFHPPGSEATLGRLFQAVMEKGVFEEELTLVRKGGERFPARLRVTAVRDAQGQITALAGMTVDLSGGRGWFPILSPTA